MKLIKTHTRRCTGCGTVGAEYHPFEDDGITPVLEGPFEVHHGISTCRCSDTVMQLSWLNKKLGTKFTLPPS